MLTPVMVLNSSPAKCDVVPVPYEAMLILPGFALAYAMNSAIVLAGMDGCTSITKGVQTIPATGVMSRAMSNGSFSKNAGLIAWLTVSKTSAYPSGGELITD